MSKWYEDHNEIARLAGHLAHAGRDAFEVANMVEKPWHYQDQYEQMETAQLAADNCLRIAAEA